MKILNALISHVVSCLFFIMIPFALLITAFNLAMTYVELSIKNDILENKK